MVVSSCIDAWLIGSADTPGVVVLPEGVGTDMSAVITFLPFEVAIDKVFPGIVVLALVLGTYVASKPRSYRAPMPILTLLLYVWAVIVMVMILITKTDRHIRKDDWMDILIAFILFPFFCC